MKDLTIGQRIRLARTRAGFTQQELANVIGHHKNSVSGWERGERTPGLQALVAVARTVGLSLDELATADPNAWAGVHGHALASFEDDEDVLLTLLGKAEDAIKHLIVSDSKEERLGYLDVFMDLAQHRRMALRQA